MLPHCRTFLLIKEVSGTGKQWRLLEISKLNTSLAACCVARLESWLLRFGISGIKQVQDEVILTPVKHSKQLMAGKRNRATLHSNSGSYQRQQRQSTVPSWPPASLLSRHFQANEMYEKDITVYPWVEPLGSDAHAYNHSLMQSSTNKTFLPQVELIIFLNDIFIFSHRLKTKSLVQLYKNSQSPYWQTESTYLSITTVNYQTNLTIPWRQELNAIFSAWANRLTFYPCPYFKDFLFWQGFTFFPLVYFLMSSKWTPEAYAPFPIPLQTGLQAPILKNQTSVKTRALGRYPPKLNRAPNLSACESAVLQCMQYTQTPHNNPFSCVITYGIQAQIITEPLNKTSQFISTDWVQSKQAAYDWPT